MKHIIQQNVSRSSGRRFRHTYLHVGSRHRAPFSWRRLFSNLMLLLAAGILAGSIFALGAFVWFSRDLPDPNNINQRALAQTTKIYDRTGEVLLYEIHGDQKRTVVDLDQISQFAKDATIASEDRDFYKHKGFSITGFIRAFITDIKTGGFAQGGSTITQQFVKNSVLTKEKVLTRKIKELVLSIQIERKFSKDQILKLYLNEIPYGSVVYGIESASQTYFGKPAKDLTLSESAVLAAMIKSPTRLSPLGSHQDELIARAHYVIDTMVSLGTATPEQAAAAKSDDVLSRIRPKMEEITAPHFVFYVRELLAERFGDQTVDRGGFKVITSLDADMQKKAEAAVADNLKTIHDYGATTAAMMAVDPKTGEIRAMVGSPDYFDESINGQYNSLLGLRQPGSSIKPMVYAAGFEKGYTPDTVLYDVSTPFERKPAGQTPYQPSDYDGAERGPVTVREALAGSLNIPAVKMLYLVGIDKFLEFAKTLGYSTFDDRSRFGLSLVLGGADVRPFEHISAFSVFPREGMIRPAKAILRVEDNDGKVLLDDSAPAPEKRVMSAETARQISSILSDNAARSFIFGETNYLTLPDRPVAAKTGTTNNWRDAWTIGYTPSLVAGVWVGNPGSATMKSRADGSKVAAPIWNEFMRAALAGTPVEQFTPPQPIVTGKPVLDGQKNASFSVKIDKVSGKLATALTPPDMIEERTFSAPHDILFFVNKDDPRGPAPSDPSSDPQYDLWETAVADWASKQDIKTSPPPTDVDDVHLPENAPAMNVLRPSQGEAIASRQMYASVSAQSKRGVRRVDFLLDNEAIGSFESYPFEGTVFIPNRFSKGFHVLTVRASDDADNSTATTLTVNLTADAGPLSAQWIRPYGLETIYAEQFPYSVTFRVDDPKSISVLKLTAIDTSGGGQTVGQINDPLLPNFTMSWPKPAFTGRYTLRLEATLKSGDVRSQDQIVYVQ